MLMEVRNQIKISLITIKYALLREMLNKTTFVTNILFMILNNASFIIQWAILYSLKDNVGGYTFKQVLLLWGFAASSYGLSRFIFKKAFELSELITNGKLDSFLVQPKNVLISSITTDVSPSAIGDILYGYIMLFLFGFSIKNFLLFTFLSVCSCFLVTSIAVILASLSFWFTRTELLADTGNSLMVNFATYPDGIFKGLSKIILFTIVPVGIANYIPVKVISNFNIVYFSIIFLITFIFITLAFIIFYRGLKRYSSSNLMNSRI